MKRKYALGALLALAASSHAWSQECSLLVEANDQIQFLQRELTVDSRCDEITLTLKHIGTLSAAVMGHNWVLTKSRDHMEVGQAGGAAGAPDYLPKGDDRVLAATPIIGGGEETTITFSTSGLDPASDYTYFCSFPGHFALMSGTLKVE